MFSFIEISFHELPQFEVVDSTSFKSNFGEKEGGSIVSHRFVQNPQYGMLLEERSLVQIKVSTEKEEDETQLMLIIFESGTDIRETKFEDITSNKNSGIYFSSFAYFDGVLESNSYTVVVSPKNPLKVSYLTYFTIDSGICDRILKNSVQGFDL